MGSALSGTRTAASGNEVRADFEIPAKGHSFKFFGTIGGKVEVCFLRFCIEEGLIHVYNFKRFKVENDIVKEILDPDGLRD